MKKDLLVDAERGNGFLLLRTEVGCEHERLVHLHVLVDQCPQFLLEYCLLSALKLQGRVVRKPVNINPGLNVN